LRGSPGVAVAIRAILCLRRRIFRVPVYRGGGGDEPGATAVSGASRPAIASERVGGVVGDNDLTAAGGAVGARLAGVSCVLPECGINAGRMIMGTSAFNVERMSGVHRRTRHS